MGLQIQARVVVAEETHREREVVEVMEMVGEVIHSGRAVEVMEMVGAGTRSGKVAEGKEKVGAEIRSGKVVRVAEEKAMVEEVIGNCKGVWASVRVVEMEVVAKDSIPVRVEVVMVKVVAVVVLHTAGLVVARCMEVVEEVNSVAAEVSTMEAVEVKGNDK